MDLAGAFAAAPEQGWQRLIDAVPHRHGPIDKSLSEATKALARTRNYTTALEALPGGADVTAAWKARRVKLLSYYGSVKRERDLATVLRALLRDHCARVHNVDPGMEITVHRLARGIAQRQIVLYTKTVTGPAAPALLTGGTAHVS